jgi:hypothetical protein
MKKIHKESELTEKKEKKQPRDDVSKAEFEGKKDRSLAVNAVM